MHCFDRSVPRLSRFIHRLNYTYERSVMLNKARWSNKNRCNRTLIAAILGAQMAVGVVAYESPVRAELAVETHDLLEFTYQQVGATEEEAIRQACLRAVHATVGRVLFSDYSLQAEDLLTPYIAKNWQQFVASTYVLERRIDRGGFGVRVRVQTFPEKVHRDLREKKFLYKAQPNPHYAVFISETVNTLPTPISNARLAALKQLSEDGLKVQDAVVPMPGYRVELADTSSVGAARAAAIQAGAEMLLLGSADTNRISQEDVLLDNMITYETALSLVLLRVNDGRVLGKVERTVRHSGTTEDEAAAGVTEKALANATRELVAGASAIREREVLNKTAYSLMFTDLTQDEVKGVSRYLESTLSYGTKAWLKSWHGNVAILNIDTERAYAAVERAIISFDQFDLRITDRQGRRITVDVQH